MHSITMNIFASNLKLPFYSVIMIMIMISRPVIRLTLEWCDGHGVVNLLLRKSPAIKLLGNGHTTEVNLLMHNLFKRVAQSGL